MSNELKPCPFCGGEVVLSYSSKGNFHFRHRTNGECMFFEFVCNITPNGVGCLAEAAEAWNRRTERSEDEAS